MAFDTYYQLSARKVNLHSQWQCRGMQSKGANLCFLVCISLITNKVGLLKKEEENMGFVYLYFFCDVGKVAVPVLCLFAFGIFGSFFPIDS